jgi:two-component system, sensor histidine kinase
MVVFPTCSPVFQVAVQGVVRAGEGDIRPGDVLGLDEHGFQAFDARPVLGFPQRRSEEHVDLVGGKHVDHGQQGADLDGRERLFVGLPCRSLLQGLAVFHESCGDCPEAPARLYGAAAQQDLPLVFGDTADDQAGILVVDRSTRIADVSRKVVTRRDAKLDPGTALITEIHGSTQSIARRSDGPARRARPRTRAGEYLLGIDGQELRSLIDPFSLLVGKQDSTVKLTVADAANNATRPYSNTESAAGHRLAVASRPQYDSCPGSPDHRLHRDVSGALVNGRFWNTLAEDWLAGGMPGPLQKSVRGKMMRIVVLTTAIALLAAGMGMLSHDLSAYRDSWVADLDTQASILATSTGGALISGDRLVAERNIHALQARPSVLVAALYGADGKLFSSFVRSGEVPPPLQLQAVMRAVRVSGGSVELIQPITENRERLGTILLRAHHDIGARALAYLGIFGLVTLMSMLVALLLSTALQKVITEPLDSMANVARQVVTRRDYSLRAHSATDDEIGLVVEAFNSMLDEVQIRARELEQSNTALTAEVRIRESAEAALARANVRLESTMAALREADRKKDEFLAILAHELRNPLAPVMHAVKLMESPVADEQQRQWGREVIARQVQRMALLLDDLLEVSRITRGRLELRKDYVDLQALVNSAVETARPLIDAKSHTLTVELPPDPIELEVDPLRLSQALSNLLTNAAKYTDARGHIRLIVSHDSQDLVIRVIDNGIGIEPHVIEGLFEMFSQIDSAIDRAEGGLGIGLALVKGLAALHGGSVEATSRGLGKGSEFAIRLPGSVIVAQPAGAAGKSTSAAMPAAKCKVVIADDNRDAADSLNLLLELAGYETFVAYNGQQTLELGARQRPAAFILDVGMPDMTGYEVARHIRQQAWGRPALLIAVTGWGQDDDKEKAKAAGFDHHFTKPVSPEQVEQALASFTLLGKVNHQTSVHSR